MGKNVLETLPHRLSVLISGLFVSIQAMITGSDFGLRVKCDHSVESY